MLAFANAAPIGEGRRAWLDRMDDEHDNLRAAFEHLIAIGDRDRVSELIHAEWRFWHMRGHVPEGRRRAERVLAMPGFPAGGSHARLRALEVAGGLGYWAGDLSEAGVFYRQAEEEARRLGDESAVANALYNRFFAREGMGTDQRTWRTTLATEGNLLDQAIAIWTRLGDEDGIARGYWGVGEHHLYRNELIEAEVALSTALEYFEPRGDAFWIAWSQFTRALSRISRGAVRDAAADFASALGAFRSAGDVSGLALGLGASSVVLLATGRVPEAYQVGGGADRLISETGLRLALLGPSGDDVPAPDLATSDPSLRAAIDDGRSWSRAEAADRTIALLQAIADGPEITVPPLRVAVPATEA
jgi:tetratricopeptide (TPR) repeat protein